jgi:hypothetical protein
MEDAREEQGKKYAKLIAKAWSDESFKERLLTNSRAVLEAEGFSVPPGVDVKVLAQTDTQLFMVIPIKPEGVAAELLDERAAAWGCLGCF